MIVYFVEAGETKGSGGRPIKVGITINLEQRISQLQNGSPIKLNLMFYISTSEEVGKELERLIHSSFHEYRMSGEWFKGSIRKLKLFTDLMKRGDCTMGEEIREKKKVLRSHKKEKSNSKKIVSYFLSQEVREEIVSRAEADSRGMSDWLDIYLKKQFQAKPAKPKVIRFRKPARQEIDHFANENNLSANGFFDYYESNGWKAGKNPMKDWHAALRGWSKRQGEFNGRPTSIKDIDF